MHNKSSLLISLFIFITFSALNSYAQVAQDSTTEFKPKGNLWGYVFGDVDYKAKADTVGNNLGSPGRGGNQYSKLPENARMFQMRRVYLGYNYDLSAKFSAEILFAAEDDITQGSGNLVAPGDMLSDNKFAPYLKLANIRWKNIFKGSDLVFGQVATPAFPLLSESVWGYRSIERTVSDIRRTPSFDQGVTLQGHFDENANFGYNIMVGNGTGAKPSNYVFMWFYGDIWAKFMDKKLIIDLYQDYQKIDWTAIEDGKTGAFHHDRNMTKLFVAYTVPKFTIGVEAFMNTLMGDVQENSATKTYYRTTIATAVSAYARGRVYKDKLGFFARYDNFDPSHKIGDITGDKRIISYAPLTSQYDPTTKEQFITFGLDYTPFLNVHVMPNLWLNTYECALPASDYFLNSKGSDAKGTDAVIRLTVYYLFGKKEGVRF